jgi:hypothetical protein
MISLNPPRQMQKLYVLESPMSDVNNKQFVNTLQTNKLLHYNAYLLHAFRYVPLHILNMISISFLTL